MARQESDREDLMSEATALVRRVELTTMGAAENVIAGFRSNGWLSIYFGPDPVYHFDADARLRRAFVRGSLYRTQGETLARLTRNRLPNVTELRRHDLTPAECDHFLSDMRKRLQWFFESLSEGRAAVVAQIPSEHPLVDDLTAKMAEVLETDKPLAPRIAGKA